MKYHGSQIGSVHAVIIILLTLGLIGALGFVFYQNFIVKPQPVVQIEKPDEPTTKTSRFAFNNDIYEFDYPKTWSEMAATHQSGVVISNPAKTIEVKLDVTSGGVGGACDTNDGLKVRYYKVHTSPNGKLTDVSLYVVEAMSDLAEGGYTYTIGLSPEGAETHAAVGDSHCTTQYVGVASKVVINPATGAVVKPTIIAKIQFPKLPDAKNTRVKSMDVVKDLINTSDYKAAVKILESARKQ